MNGWQRMFVVFSVIVIIIPAAVWIADKPDGAQAKRWAFSCALRDQNVSPQEAKNLLMFEHDAASGPDCTDSLKSIASGKAYRDDIARWTGSFKAGALVIGVFLAVVYALGWALGWIWRGFFPKKL